MSHIRSLVREGVAGQEAYFVEDVPARIKLDANENPYPLPMQLRNKLFAAMKSVNLHHYPEPGSPRLQRAYARHFGVGEDMILIGNGSDEAIAILSTALARPGAAILIPVPTFPMYRITALNNGYKVHDVPLDEQGDLELDAMEHLLKTEKPAITFLSYPNNPTGGCFHADRVERLIKASPGVVVVDEAYFHFSGKTFLPKLKQYERLVILRSLSKIGLAAMRIGFLIGAPELVKELNKVRPPYNLNALSQVAAAFYLEHESVFLDQAARIRRECEKLLRALRSIRGVQACPTDANFIFFYCKFREDDVYQALLREGVLVKKFSRPGAASGIRVTVGTRKENGEFLRIVRSVLVPGR
ncbi:MAG: histidinol-phosphate transaminase [Syntrophaceae bacterium]|nr:histidinol-phosphate transaminase [Syntrophaceae bacterium]